LKLVYGVGVNDATYRVQKFETVGYTEEGKQIQKLIWVCPFYSRWKGMLQRCYSKVEHKRYPNYIGCHAVSEWHKFSNFKAWMERQDWEGNHLDKDILFPGNKIYGPETCVFVAANVNIFLTESTSSQGEWPVGVSFHKEKAKFQAQCNDVVTGKRKHLGCYKTPEAAHKAWLSFKLEQARILASKQTDKRIAKALIERYENYNERN